MNTFEVVALCGQIGIVFPGLLINEIAAVANGICDGFGHIDHRHGIVGVANNGLVGHWIPSNTIGAGGQANTRRRVGAWAFPVDHFPVVIGVGIGWVKENTRGHIHAPACFVARGTHHNVGAIAQVGFFPVIAICGVSQAECVLRGFVFDAHKIIESQAILFGVGQDGDRDEHVALFVRLVGCENGLIVSMCHEMGLF